MFDRDARLVHVQLNKQGPQTSRIFHLMAQLLSNLLPFQDTLDQEETKVSGLINYLNTISTLAPMVGLFGTVIGMITAFGQLTSGKAEPSDLAGGIGTAMLTTV